MLIAKRNQLLAKASWLRQEGACELSGPYPIIEFQYAQCFGKYTK